MSLVLVRECFVLPVRLEHLRRPAGRLAVLIRWGASLGAALLDGAVFVRRACAQGRLLALDAGDVFGGKRRVANGRHRRLGLALCGGSGDVGLRRWLNVSGSWRSSACLYSNDPVFASRTGARLAARHWVHDQRRCQARRHRSRRLATLAAPRPRQPRARSQSDAHRATPTWRRRAAICTRGQTPQAV